MRNQIALAVACVLLLSVAGVPAQQPTFKSSIELVLIDAVVVDKDGHAVRGLKAADFALTDQKKLQSIETFEEISHERTPGQVSAPTLPPGLKLDVASNVTVQADRLVMVFIDDLHIWKGRTEAAQAIARDVVGKLGSQASMAIVFSSREGSTEVTQDRAQLLAAIDGMKARQTFRRPHQGFLKQGARYVDPAMPIEFKLAALAEAQRASLQDLNDNNQHFETLKNAAQMLVKEFRRRKAFVVISEGLNADMSGLQGGGIGMADIVGEQPNLNPDLNPRPGANGPTEVIAALRRANVTLYAIDPRGKVRAEDMMLESWPPIDCAVCENPPALPEPAERIQSRDDSQFAWNNGVRVAQAGLGFLSEAAGGFAVTDTDDLTGGLDRILEDLDHYYLLGFYPADTGGGNKTHPVQLTVPGHPDYTIRFRRGYVPGLSSPALKSRNPLTELAAGVLPMSDLPLRLTAMPLPGRGKTASVAVALEVTATVGLMKEADNKLRDDVSYSVMVVDDKRAKVTQRTGRSAKFTMRAEDPGRPTPDTVTYQIPLLIDLEPGRYQLRASAMSKKLDKGGSVYLDISVPDFSKTTLALTTIALGFADGPRVPVGRTPMRTAGVPSGMGVFAPALPPAQERAQNSQNPLPFEPTLSREFEQADAIRVYFQVARSDPKTTVALEIRVFDAGNEQRLSFDAIVEPYARDSVDLRVPLGTLGSGAFTIRVNAGDGRNTAKTQTGFIIK